MSNYLYHGSKFDNQGKPLVPGIMHTGEEVFWDGGFESNRYLYATDSPREAIMLGIGSMTEKDLGTAGFKYETDTDDLVFIFDDDKLISEKSLEAKLKGKKVYLYTIPMKLRHGWVQNNNALNNIDGEFKTDSSIPNNDYVKTEIEVLKWMKANKKTIVTTTRSALRSQEKKPTSSSSN